MRYLFCFALAGLAACDPPPEQARPLENTSANLPPNSKSGYGNRYSAELSTRTIAEQGSLLAKIVQSSGERCARGSKPDFKGNDGGIGFWVVRCGREDFLVAIDADSSTKVLSCKIKKALGDDNCRSPW